MNAIIRKQIITVTCVQKNVIHSIKEKKKEEKKMSHRALRIINFILLIIGLIGCYISIAVGYNKGIQSFNEFDVQILLYISFPLAFFSLLFQTIDFIKQNRHLRNISYHANIALFGLFLAIALVLDVYPSYIFIIVFASISAIINLIVMIVSLIEYFQRTKKQIITTAISESNDNDKIELLKKYKELYDSGVITKDEFEAKKAKLLK